MIHPNSSARDLFKKTQKCPASGLPGTGFFYEDLSDEQESNLEAPGVSAAVEDYPEFRALLLKQISSTAIRETHIRKERPLFADPAPGRVGVIAQALAVKPFDHLIDERVIQSPYICLGRLYLHGLHIALW